MCNCNDTGVRAVEDGKREPQGGRTMTGRSLAAGDVTVQGDSTTMRVGDSASHSWFASMSAVAIIVAAVAWGPGAMPAYATQTCANEAARAEQGAAGLALPDCRAYEMVSPPGSVPAHASAQALAAVSGQRFAYYTFEPAPGSTEEGLFLLATRGAGGWTVQNATPPQGGVHNSDFFACYPSVVYSSELTLAVLSDGWNQVEEGFDNVCVGDDPPLVAGEPRGYANLFLRNNEDGTYQVIDRPLPGAMPANAVFHGASPDLSHVVFSDEAKLAPMAPAGSALYEWSGNADYLVSVLPDSEPVAGTLASKSGFNYPLFTHAVSASGETIFFYYDGGLYARLHTEQEPTASGECSASEPDKACTVQVDAAQAGAPDPSGGGTFVYASEDGSRVFFTDEHELTVNATADKEKPDLYEYDVETGRLSDLTASATGPANVLGFSGGSADGSYIYFVATGVLSGGQGNDFGAAAVHGRPNLYLWHAGITTFIATLEGGPHKDVADWQQGYNESEHNTGYLTARVSPDGRYIAFNSLAQLTGYENEQAESSECEEEGEAGRCREIFLYDAEEGELSCASCSASGEQPTGPAAIPPPERELLTPEAPLYLERNVTDAGQVFFDARGALVPQATNGEVNVYEYENGVVSLISSGTGSGGADFLDASASGSDVFFSTDQGLVQGDTDNQTSVYDARVDGGFPGSASEVVSGSGCESEEACKPPPSEPPVQLLAASAALSASGDLLAPLVPVTPARHGGKAVVRRALTRAQKLARALKECARKPRARRPACRAEARRRLAVLSKRRTTSSGRKPRVSRGIKGRKGTVR